MTLRAGSTFQVRFTTWGGASTGTRLSRQRNTFDSAHDWVSLVPDGGKAWTASFYDVVLLRDGSLFVDDAGARWLRAFQGTS